MLYKTENYLDSRYNFGVFSKEESGTSIESFLKSRLTAFCNDLNISVDHLKELSFESVFTDIEFNKLVPDENEESFINKHFYTKLFYEVKKVKVLDELRNRDILSFEFNPKFCFTFDKELTPKISSSNILYGTLSLGEKPVLYYIWVDIQNIISLVKHAN